MNPLTLFLVGLIGFFIVIPTLLFLLFRKKIMAFFKPNDWCLIEMIERDNNVISWLQKKDKDLQFVFNEGTYNMFDVITEEGRTNYKKVFSSIYREGRLAKLYYKEGEQNPLDIRNLRIVNDAQQANMQGKIAMSRLMKSGYSLANEIWQKYGLFLILGILILLLYLVFKGNGPTPPTTTAG